MNYSIPKLYIPQKGNDWYIHYRIFNPATGRKEQYKERRELNRIKDKRERKKEFTILLGSLSDDLKSGWTPFQKEEEQPVYNTDFYWWFEERLKYSKAKHGLYIWKNQNNVYNKLKAFAPTLLIGQLTYKFLLDFEKHLIEKGNHPNTIADNLVRIKVVVNEIVRSGAMEYHKNPFLNFKFKTKRVERKRLSYDDIKKLEVKELENSQDQARDMYILSFNIGGIRFGDICRLQNAWFTPTHLKYTMHKTDKERFIKLTETAKRIVKKYEDQGKYLFDTRVNWEEEEKSIDARNSFYNQRLKEACEKAEIPKISFHTARHSFADFALLMGIPPIEIKEMLGHTLFATTEGYLTTLRQESSDLTIDIMFGKND